MQTPQDLLLIFGMALLLVAALIVSAPKYNPLSGQWVSAVSVHQAGR